MEGVIRGDPKSAIRWPAKGKALIRLGGFPNQGETQLGRQRTSRHGQRRQATGGGDHSLLNGHGVVMVSVTKEQERRGRLVSARRELRRVVGGAATRRRRGARRSATAANTAMCHHSEGTHACTAMAIDRRTRWQ